jgi:hypothetical protein
MEMVAGAVPEASVKPPLAASPAAPHNGIMEKGIFRQLQSLGDDLRALWTEAASVVWLRWLKLARGGPEAIDEAALLVGEKLAAQQELLARLATGRLGVTPLAVTSEVSRYLLKGVRDNRRRLSRSGKHGRKARVRREGV